MFHRLLAIIPLVFFSCVSADQQKTVRVGRVNGSVYFRVIGSYGQQSDPQTLADIQTAYPIDIRYVPIEVLLKQVGSASEMNIEIMDIGEDFDLEIVGSGIQNSSAYMIKTSSETITVGK